MNGFLEQPAIQALGWALVHSLWQGGVIALLAWAALRGLRGRRPEARYLVACGALALMFLAPTATWWLLARPEAGAAPGATAAAAGGGLDALLRPWLPWAAGSWMAGVALMSCRLLGGWVWLQRLRWREARTAPAPWPARVARLGRQLGLRGPVGILESLAVDVPMVIGWVRPVILVPAAAFAGLDPAGLEAVLAHELAHIRRHDYLVNLLQSVVEALLFYHPAVWWISRQIRAERENCCDDAAVALCGDPVRYARALASLEGLRRVRPVQPNLAPAADGGMLMSRIRRLIQPGLPPFPAARAGLAVLLTVSGLGAASLTLAQDPPKPADPPRVVHKKIVVGDPKGQDELQAKARDLESKARELARRVEAVKGSDFAKLQKDLAEKARELAEMARRLAAQEMKFRTVHIPPINIEGRDLHIPPFSIDGRDFHIPPINIEGRDIEIPDFEGRDEGAAPDAPHRHRIVIRRGGPEVDELRAEVGRLKARLDRLDPQPAAPAVPAVPPASAAPPAPATPPAN